MKKKMNVVEKILSAHLVEGDAAKDSELGIRIDQIGRASCRERV